MWGSERKPDWLEMFSSFSELKLLSIRWVKYLQFLESDSYCLTNNWFVSAYLAYMHQQTKPEFSWQN